ncbi:hypothetical protein PG990_006167 [Apiospora arundinis]|uniref:E3 ubiquitin-protein ligase RDUF2 n=1 Tax=Apiospora arundinis TaxID=335852 RepID=A0ABR2J9F3_9PEZI
MDPSAMDFVMHRSPSEPSRLLSDPMPQHHSPCPAMRAAAAATSASEQAQIQGLGASSRMSGRPHYDPVHGSTSSGGWWQQPQPQQHQYSHQQAMPHLGWPPALYPPYARTNAPLYAPNFPPVPPPNSNPNTGTSSHIPPRLHNHENFNGHAHPLSQMHSPPTFHHPPTMSSLNRIGGSAPAHHSQGFSTQGNGPESHVPRTTGLPALHPFSSMAQNQTSHRCSTQSFANNSPSDMDTALRTRPDIGDQPRGNTEASNFSHDDLRVTMGFRRHQPQPHQPSPPPMGDLPGLHPSEAHSRRPRFQPSSSEPSSDEDTDPEHDAQTLRFLEAVASTNGIGLMPQYVGSEERIRAQQLLRGTVSGKRVASKSAIASLESVAVSELTETERTCIICYNEFGVENPEGVNEAPLRLPKCKHIFGDHCIKKWFEESDSCPYCRDKVPSEPQFHHGRPHSNQAMMQLVRQHHGFGMSQAFGGHRQVRGDPNTQNRPGDPPRVTSLNFGEVYEQAPMFRRSDGSSFRSSLQSSPGRRSPSADINEGRRRTRARHGSFRGSPPSTRPMSYTATSGGPMSPFARPYGNSNLGRHSVQLSSASPRTRPQDTPPFELNTPPPVYPGPDVGGHQPSRGSSDVANNGTYPQRSDWRSPWGYQHPELEEARDNRAPFQQSP